MDNRCTCKKEKAPYYFFIYLDLKFLFHGKTK